jgi:hypothetical protein
MTLPSTVLNKVAGSLNTSPPAPKIPFIVGPSSGGTKNKLLTFGTPTNVQSAGGYGPGVTAAMSWLKSVGGTCNVVFANASIAGTVGTVTSGSGTPAMTVTGTPYDSYQAVVSCVRAGTIGTAQFTFSLDNGTTPSANRTLASSFVVPNTGLTLGFATGSYSVGQSWTFNAYAPQMTGADLDAAFAPLFASQANPNLTLVMNDAQSALSGSALFTETDATCTSMQATNQVPMNCIVPTGGTTGNDAADAATWSSFATALGNNVMAVADRAVFATPNAFEGYAFPLTPLALAVFIQAGQIDPSTPVFWRGLGLLADWSSPTYDERLDGELWNLTNVVAPMTKARQPGIYLNGESVKCAPGSAYDSFCQCRVINLLYEVVQDALLPWEGKTVMVNPDGTLDSTTADRIDSDVNSADERGRDGLRLEGDVRGG